MPVLSHGAKHCQNAPCSAGTRCCCQPSRDNPRRSSGYRSRMKLSLSPPVPILVRSARQHGAKSVIKLTLSCVELHEDGEPGIERGAPAVGTGGRHARQCEFDSRGASRQPGRLGAHSGLCSMSSYIGGAPVPDWAMLYQFFASAHTKKLESILCFCTGILTARPCKKH